MNKELELKYNVDKDFKIIRFLQVLTKNGFWITSYKDDLHVDTYYDTKDYDLLKLGGGLRIRSNDGSNKVTFKMPLNLDKCFSERLEIERNINENSINDAILALKDIDFDLSCICPFPILTIRNNRYSVLFEKEDEVIEVSFDKVNYYNHSLNSEEECMMIEVEAKEGTKEKTLINIDLLVKEKLGLESSNETKYEHGLMLTNSQKLIRKFEKKVKND